MENENDYMARLLEKRRSAAELAVSIRFGEKQEIEVDVLVIGGGIAGCWAAISAARTGVKVVLLKMLRRSY